MSDIDVISSRNDWLNPETDERTLARLTLGA